MAATLRRLARDHAALRANPPADYFFPSTSSSDSDLTTLTTYLIGPSSTPFESGLFTLTLRIPPTYPTAPPAATFRTKIFHPNVDERTGDVCVDTLKRDWSPKLTLRDVLITIRCLLVYPNPTSSLNEAAGKLLLDDFDGFSSRARLMAEVHAPVPEALRDEVDATRQRDAAQDDDSRAGKSNDGSNSNDAKAPADASASSNNAKGPAPAAARRIRRAVSPTAKPTQIADASIPATTTTTTTTPSITTASTTMTSVSAVLDASADDSDSDSGKENVLRSRSSSLRHASSSESVKRAYDHDAPEQQRSGTPDGRKSPKLAEDASPSRTAAKPSPEKQGVTVVEKKKVICSAKDTKASPLKKKVVSSSTPAAARKKSTMHKPKTGLKRF